MEEVLLHLVQLMGHVLGIEDTLMKSIIKKVILIFLAGVLVLAIKNIYFKENEARFKIEHVNPNTGEYYYDYIYLSNKDTEKVLNALHKVNLEGTFLQQQTDMLNKGVFGMWKEFCIEITAGNEEHVLEAATFSTFRLDQKVYAVSFYDPFYDVMREMMLKYLKHPYFEFLYNSAIDQIIEVKWETSILNNNRRVISISGEQTMNTLLEYLQMPLLDEDIKIRDYYLKATNVKKLNNEVQIGDFTFKVAYPNEKMGFIIKLDGIPDS